jgi:DNA-binding transcriptional LysR family regulator
VVLFPQLRLFRDIAQTRSVSKGAQMNGISQSAASQHIHDLEKHLGVVLFDRSTRPVTLTEAGRLYADLCRDVLRREEELRAALDELTGAVEGEVRVASIYSVGLSEMSELQGEFTRRYPGARLHVDYMRPDKVYEAVLRDHADLGLVSYPEGSRELTVLPWRKEEMTVAAAPWHPLARRPVLKLEDLNGVPYIGFDEELTIRRELDRYFHKAGVDLNLVMQFDNIQMVKEAVAIGSGISVLPARVLRADVEQGRLKSIPILAPDLFRPLGIVHRRRKRFGRAAQAFLDLLQGKEVSLPVPV